MAQSRPIKLLISCTSGMTSSYFAYTLQNSLSSEEQVADMINSVTAVSCTGCAYCVDGCPKQIAIPKFFSLYNEDMGK